MPINGRPLIGNLTVVNALYFAAVTFPTLAANATGTNTLAVPGAVVGDMIVLNLQAPAAHVFVENAYVSAVGVVTILWGTDGTGVSTATAAALLLLLRPENASMGLSFLPSNVS